MCYFHPGREHVLGIHREAPSFIEQGTEQEILETGIKVNIYILLDTFIYTYIGIEIDYFVLLLSYWKS